MHLEGGLHPGVLQEGLIIKWRGVLIIDRANKRKLTTCASFCFSVLSSDSDQLLMPTGTLGRVATMAEGKSPPDL